jgi:hypothetical protein
MAEDEEEAGPTIFEAAADEEITATHWCDDPSNEDFSPSRLPFSEASSSPPHLFPQGVPLPQEPQRRQGRRRRQQPGVRPRVQLHARLPRRLPQPLVDVDQEDRGALSREGPKTLVSRAGERRTLARA